MYSQFIWIIQCLFCIHQFNVMVELILIELANIASTCLSHQELQYKVEGVKHEDQRKRSADLLLNSHHTASASPPPASAAPFPVQSFAALTLRTKTVTIRISARLKVLNLYPFVFFIYLSQGLCLGLFLGHNLIGNIIKYHSNETVW